MCKSGVIPDLAGEQPYDLLTNWIVTPVLLTSWVDLLRVVLNTGFLQERSQ